MKKLYKISEFASMCGVTRELLLYYDQCGLLHPAHIADSGYRYYSLSQMRTLNIILNLRASGMSLKEIGEYLTQPGLGVRFRLLKAQVQALEQQERQIRAKRMALEQSVGSYLEGAKCQYGVLEVRQMPEEYLIASPTRYTKMPDEETFLRTFRNHLKYCEQKELSTRLQAGEIIPLERARRRCFVESHYFNPVQSRVEDERLYIKPAGEYAVYYHQGELEDLEVAFHLFVDEVERQGYQLCGDVYEDDLVEELLLSQTALSVARLTARVEKAER